METETVNVLHNLPEPLVAHSTISLGVEETLHVLLNRHGPGRFTIETRCMALSRGNSTIYTIQKQTVTSCYHMALRCD